MKSKLILSCTLVISIIGFLCVCLGQEGDKKESSIQFRIRGHNEYSFILNSENRQLINNFVIHGQNESNDDEIAFTWEEIESQFISVIFLMNGVEYSAIDRGDIILTKKNMNQILLRKCWIGKKDKIGNDNTIIGYIEQFETKESEGKILNARLYRFGYGNTKCDHSWGNILCIDIFKENVKTCDLCKRKFPLEYNYCPFDGTRIK